MQIRSVATLGTVVVAFVASLVSGCTTVLYKGPSRPASEIAVIISRETLVHKVDNVMVKEMASGTNARFELLPGEHEVAISYVRTIPGFFSTTVQSSRNIIIVCLDLEAGHTYETRGVVSGDRWLPRVMDLTTRSEVDPYCEDEEDRRRPVAAGATSPPKTATPVTAPTVDTATDGAAPSAAPAPDGTAPALVAAQQSDAGASPLPLAAPPAAPPAAPAIAKDREEPPRALPAPAAHHVATDSSKAEVSDRRPGSGFTLFFGLALGGEDFASASSSNGSNSSVSSGGGVILGVGGMVTPLWVSSIVGFGLGTDMGVKYDSISADNGSASITRYPLAFTAHLLTNGSGGHCFLLRGGLVRDLGVNYQASGFATVDANVEGTWGPTGSIGYYKRSNDSFAWDIMGFFAVTDHLIGPQKVKVNANSFGLTVGLHLNL